MSTSPTEILSSAPHPGENKIKRALRRLAIWALCMLTIGLASFAAFCIDARGFLPEKQFNERAHGASPDVTSIALLGDSWIATGDLGGNIKHEMANTGWVVDLVSFGEPGARSKKIYQNLFAHQDREFSSRPILFGEEAYDFVVIVAGVNDAAGYMGADFYVHHIALIINAVSKRGSTAVIVELPEFGLEETDSNNPVGFLRRRIFRLLFHDSQVDVISEYRAALETWLEIHKAREDYILVDFDQVADDYTKHTDLYKSDLVHLNEKGNVALARAISAEIQMRLADKGGS